MEDFKGIAADAAPWIWIGVAAMVGRLMYHAKLVQAGKRKAVSWVLFWDIPIAVCMGWITLGFGKWIGLDWEPTVSLSMVMAYLGPYSMDTVFRKWADWKFGKKSDVAN